VEGGRKGKRRKDIDAVFHYSRHSFRTLKGKEKRGVEGKREGKGKGRRKKGRGIILSAYKATSLSRSERKN